MNFLKLYENYHNRDDMSESKFIKELDSKGFKYSVHHAMSGSMYWTIQGLRYRISDHYNPNKCFEDSRIEVISFENILSRIESDLEARRIENENREYLYDSKTDDFYKNPNFKQTWH